MLTRAHFRIFREQLWRKLLNRRIPCPLCGSCKASPLYKSPNVHMAVFRAFFAERVVVCDDCGFVYTNPRLSAKNLERYYTKSYRLEGLEVPKSVEEFLGDQYREIWCSKERDLNLVLGVKTEGRLLDIGCASGTLLWLARQKGFVVTGVEVARGAAEFARHVLGLDVFCGQLQDSNFRDGEFDIVTMFHSLEHVPEPRLVLREIHRILADEGALIIVVPNLGGWSAKKDGAKWRWLQPQNHYSHFTPESLAVLARREGFVPSISSEEGRYGEEEIHSLYSAEGVPRVHSEIRGSEIILLGRKRPADAVTEAATTASVSAAGCYESPRRVSTDPHL